MSTPEQTTGPSASQASSVVFLLTFPRELFFLVAELTLGLYSNFGTWGTSVWSLE